MDSKKSTNESGDDNKTSCKKTEKNSQKNKKSHAKASFNKAISPGLSTNPLIDQIFSKDSSKKADTLKNFKIPKQNADHVKNDFPPSVTTPEISPVSSSKSGSLILKHQTNFINFEFVR